MAFKDREHARAMARLGGLARQAKDRAKHAPPPPFDGDMVAMMDAAGLTGESWAPWRTLWSAIAGRPLTDEQMTLFMRATGRTRVPDANGLREAWVIAGRRSGKSRAGAALFALWSAIRCQWSDVLAPGEVATIPLVASDRGQARSALNYIKGLLALPALKQYAGAALRDSITTTTGARIVVTTASWTATRGYTSPACVLDEVAFFPVDEAGADCDTTILDALRPSMATIADSLLFACSTPYAPRGELFKAHERAFGRDDCADTLVWVLPTLEMNLTVDPRVVARAYEADPVAAASEFGATFRRDVQALLDAEAVRAVTILGRRELPFDYTNRYVGFVDPAGGSGGDSFTMAIAHREMRGADDLLGEAHRTRMERSGLVPPPRPERTGVAILDLVREIRPPFSPDQAVRELRDTLASYNVNVVVGDRFGGSWPAERFNRAGLKYQPSTRTKSVIYSELLPLINSGRVELLDLPRLAQQLTGLERRTARSGADSIDHGPGGRDDVSNAVGGALLLALDRGTAARVHGFSV